jgi:hypothetical protein
MIIVEENGEKLRFYLKKIGDGYHIYHRLSHQFIEGAEDEETAAELLDELNSLTEEGLIRTLLMDYKVKLPHKDVLLGIRRDTGWAESEDALKRSWIYGTTEFFTEHPELLVIEPSPYEQFQQVREKIIERQSKDEKRRMLEDQARMARERDHKPTVTAKLVNGIKQLVVRLPNSQRLVVHDQGSPFA